MHGDDFATSGEDEDLAWLKEQMDGRFEMKTQMVGSKHAKEGKVLNRVIRITENGWEYEADQRHGELIVEMMGLKEANGVNSPGEEPKAWEEEEDEEELEDQMARDYRGGRPSELLIDGQSRHTVCNEGGLSGNGQAQKGRQQ